ncbi:nucleotidyl transferase AbiEii/AbiGii toxin family protein [Sphingomonas sp. LaA6.9]|uniref:nucleotidyl transferase AbiEii/AbiGii toxin family protein n=1 Tax=Sphingomonas sp. LaA6.9 TaxID=2919914 RepID=UPI001F4FC8D4|nr:nucleotidyl transferase AbiEii/AbiGii toxin family protein [Sphingomonas sp. LaA6.9]MCJ8159128.1 nucleotidyl transferase AbiEii/AbiGii toxin family protein [Sphingomonas sp. LaA6.9]
MIEIIQEKLRQYRAANAVEEENATKETIQEIALYALWRGDFFDVALFQGGTSLRILHRLPRFSEALDFMLRSPNPEFDWAPYLKTLVEVFAQFGLKLDAQPKERMDKAVREAVLKDNSIASQLDLTFAGTGRRKTIRIKLEIDTNPPSASGETTTFLDFPADYEVRHQDLPSNFALKIHALLCRGYLKGRDWFDFSWYVSNGVLPNLTHLQAALIQAGPWAGRDALQIDMAWLEDTLRNTIVTIDWKAAADDVRRFLRPAEAKSLALWSDRFFLAKLEKMAAA